MTDTQARRYMVDGRQLTADEVRALFPDTPADPSTLDDRERIAFEWVGQVANSGRFLDVGCYSGAFVAELTRRHAGIDAWGVDYFEDNVEIARLAHPALAAKFRRMSAYGLEFADESFDCVAFKEVIEHIHRPVEALREINRILRPGGHLVLTTPNANADAWRVFLAPLRNLARRLAGRDTGPGHEIFYEDVEWNRHLYAWTARTLNTLLASNGFECVEHRFYRHGWIQRLFPEAGDGLAFLVRKSGPAPTNLV